MTEQEVKPQAETLDAPTDPLQQPAPNGVHAWSGSPAPSRRSADSSDDEGSCESVDIQLGGSLASASQAPAEEMTMNGSAEAMADGAEEHASAADTAPLAHAAGPAAMALAAAAAELGAALQPPLDATSDSADSVDGDAPAAALDNDSEEATSAQPAVTGAATDASPAQHQMTTVSSAQQPGGDAATQQQSAVHDVPSSGADAPEAPDMAAPNVTCTMGASNMAATADAAALQQQLATADSMPDDTTAEQPPQPQLSLAMRASESDAAKSAHSPQSGAGRQATPDRQQPAAPAAEAPTGPDTPVSQTPSAEGPPEEHFPHAEEETFVPTGLRERESRPYHMQPAGPERFSLGRRPSPSTTPLPQHADSESSWQSTSSDNEDMQQRQDTAQAKRAARAAADALRKAERQRERERQELRERLAYEQAAREAQRAVIGRCALRVGAAGDADCQAGDECRSIRDNQSYAEFTCSEGCHMLYHHPVCYHRLVDALRQQRHSFKGFKGKDALPCLTDMCTGVLIEATLHKVSEEGHAEPPVVWIERPKPKKPKAQPRSQPVDASKQRGGKRGKFTNDAEHGDGQSGEHGEPAAPRQQHQQHQSRHASQPEPQAGAEASPEPSPKKEPVHIPLPEELDGRLQEYKREEQPDVFAVPRRKPEALPTSENLAAQQARIERKKKAMMRLRLDEFVGEQPEQQGDAYHLHSQQQAWGRRDTYSHQQDDRLLPRRTPPPAEAGGALTTAAFPSLQQALDGGQGPDGHAMVVLAALRQLQQEQRWGVPTKVLLLECLDVAGIAEELGTADAEGALEDQLRAVFEPYGDIYRLRTFSEQEAAALEFSDTAAAARAKVHEDGRQMGRKPMRASHLTRYPTDEVVDDTIRAQLEAEEEARNEAARASGHLPSRNSRAPAWSFGEQAYNSHAVHGTPQRSSFGEQTTYGFGDYRVAQGSSFGNGSLNAGAAEFRPSGSLSAVIHAPEFVPGATWRSGSLGSGNGLADATRSSAHSAASAGLPSGTELPGGIAGSPVEEDIRRVTPIASGSGGAAIAGREDDAAAVITQLERDEAMARALAEEDGVLARQLQEQEDERMARELAGDSGGLGVPRPALPPRSETWAAGQEVYTGQPVSPMQRVATPPPTFAAADEDSSPVGVDVWGFEEDAASAPTPGAIAGMQPDAAFLEAWGSGGDAGGGGGGGATGDSAPQPGDNELAAAWAMPPEDSAPAGAGQSLGSSQAAEDLRFQPVAASAAVPPVTEAPAAEPPAAQAADDDDDPFGWMMNSNDDSGNASSGMAGGSNTGASADVHAGFGSAAAGSSNAVSSTGAVASSSSSGATGKRRGGYDPTRFGAPALPAAAVPAAAPPAAE